MGIIHVRLFKQHPLNLNREISSPHFELDVGPPPGHGDFKVLGGEAIPLLRCLYLRIHKNRHAHTRARGNDATQHNTPTLHTRIDKHLSTCTCKTQTKRRTHEQQTALLISSFVPNSLTSASPKRLHAEAEKRLLPGPAGKPKSTRTKRTNPEHRTQF